MGACGDASAGAGQGLNPLTEVEMSRTLPDAGHLISSPPSRAGLMSG
jgi:hypothetical protein